MNDLWRHIWLVPLLPLLAAFLILLQGARSLRFAQAISLLGMLLTTWISAGALWAALHGSEVLMTGKVAWMHWGHQTLWLGWVVDRLSAVMMAMVSGVGLLIFLFSTGYMAKDPRAARFFSYMNLFVSAMMMVVLANSLVLLFIGWELMGLASYLLIGFWYQKPSAVAAAQKAFLTTRLGDIGLLLGMVWLASETGTLLFLNNGHGALEGTGLSSMAGSMTYGGMSVSFWIAMLLFVGAVGKSGQFPLHVWLPDAMEGPTPVSALIHAATMVVAGVYLVARTFPLFLAGTQWHGVPAALCVVGFVGAFTALFAAVIAVAQTDIKRVLAYSTVSQLGYMMLGLAAGGVAVGMFHLITHACFKALLFLGAGSVIHACHHEQDIRKMGGLWLNMPVTFITYTVGMLALAGFPLFFSGFWSKDEILFSALHWEVSRIPFLMAFAGVFLTAFYMTRQVGYVFFGPPSHASHKGEGPHENRWNMTLPLVVLAAVTVLLSVVGTPVWPAFHHFIDPSAPETSHDWKSVVALMAMGTLVVLLALCLGGWLYIYRNRVQAGDPLERLMPGVMHLLRQRFYLDELYAALVTRSLNLLSRFMTGLETAWIELTERSLLVVSVVAGWMCRTLEDSGINALFDSGCRGCREGGTHVGALQNGRWRHYLRWTGIVLAVLILMLTWGVPW